MKRRDVIKVSAVTAGATLGVPGCAIPRLMASLSGADGAAAFLQRMEGPGLLARLMATTAKVGTSHSPEVTAKLAEQDELFRRMLGTLLVTQGFRDLPPETQLEPAVQERMWSHMDEIGETVFQVGDMLAALDGRQRDTVQQTLRAQPDLPMMLGQSLDDSAAAAGISAKRRLQLRQMMSQAAFRMRHGDPVSIIDEYVDKVDRVRARGEHDAEALAFAQQLGDRAFWRYQHLLQQQPDPSAPPIAAGPGATPPRAPAPVTPTKPKSKPGSKGMKVGGYMLGIGIITFGLSALLVDASEAFLVGATVGALLFAIGLLVVLISAIIAATASPQ
jgi:hypothetical protein